MDGKLSRRRKIMIVIVTIILTLLAVIPLILDGWMVEISTVILIISYGPVLVWLVGLIAYDEFLDEFLH